MSPDYFSVMAINSLATVLPRWHSWAIQAQTNPILSQATYSFPVAKTKFLGTVIQKYRLRQGGAPSAAFQKWINEINIGVKNKLVPVLEANNMLLDAFKYESAGITAGDPLLQMSDFNSLIALSQKHQTPVFCLSDEQLEQTGIVLKRTKHSMENFKTLFSDAADLILKIV